MPSPVDEVRPLLGTGGTGHAYPGAVYPFGLVQLGPDTGERGWDHCSGYKYDDKSIMGFTHTHLHGTGCADLGDILFQPTTGEIRLDVGDPKTPNPAGYRSSFSHDEESASPGYYRVLLKDYGINVELTATAHAGFHKYTFPASDQAHIIVDLVHGVGGKPVEAALTQENLYIQSATLNGKPLSRSYMTHAELVRGGELVLEMGVSPNTAWGRDRADRPPSLPSN